MTETKIKKKHQVLTGENLTAAQRRTYIIVIGLLSTLMPFSVDSFCLRFLESAKSLMPATAQFNSLLPG